MLFNICTTHVITGLVPVIHKPSLPDCRNKSGNDVKNKNPSGLSPHFYAVFQRLANNVGQHKKLKWTNINLSRYTSIMTQGFEYKVVIYRESMLGSLFLGGSKVDPVKFSDFLNRNGADGWEVATMERESRRMLLFFEREAFMVVMKRPKGGANE